MSTAPRFAAHESVARRIAAGLAVVLTLGLAAGLDKLADRQYDDVVMAQVTANTPVQLVFITGKRLQQA